MKYDHNLSPPRPCSKCIFSPNTALKSWNCGYGLLRVWERKVTEGIIDILVGNSSPHLFPTLSIYIFIYIIGLYQLFDTVQCSVDFCIIRTSSGVYITYWVKLFYSHEDESIKRYFLSYHHKVLIVRLSIGSITRGSHAAKSCNGKLG